MKFRLALIALAAVSAWFAWKSGYVSETGEAWSLLGKTITPDKADSIKFAFGAVAVLFVAGALYKPSKKKAKATAGAH